MRNKTVKPTDKHQQASPNKKQGLIAKGKNTRQSGTTESALSAFDSFTYYCKAAFLPMTHPLKDSH